MNDEERLSIKLASRANKCRKDSLAEMVLISASHLVYDLGKFNHAMAHAFGYSNTGFELSEFKRAGLSIPVEGNQK